LFPVRLPKLGWNSWRLKIAHEQNGCVLVAILGEKLLQNNKSVQNFACGVVGQLLYQ